MLAVLAVAAATFIGTIYHERLAWLDGSEGPAVSLASEEESGGEEEEEGTLEHDEQQQQQSALNQAADVVNDLIIGPTASIRLSSADLLSGSSLPKFDDTIAA